MKNTYAERNPQLLLFSHSVFISRVPDVCVFTRCVCVCFFVCFSGLQRETDSSTNAGLEMDAISERNIRPLLGYDWIAGGLFNNAKKINLSAMEDFPVLICINGIHHSFHPSRCFFWKPEVYRFSLGLLDAESSLEDCSEQFFSDLRSFRQANRDECIHRLLSGSVSVCHLLHNKTWLVDKEFLCKAVKVTFVLPFDVP